MIVESSKPADILEFRFMLEAENASYAAKRATKEDIEKITESTRILQSRYDVVLLEGAGGLMVPITRRYLTVDYIADQKLPVILVTSGRLGSINHTLLSIEALVNRNIPLYGIVYNTFPKTDERIDKDTEEYLKTYLNEHFPQAHFWTLPEIALPR